MCVPYLKIEHQEACKLATEATSFIFTKFLVMKKKHYVALLRDKTNHSKGVSDVRRSSYQLNQRATRDFIDILLRNRAMKIALTYLTYKYIELCANVYGREARSLYYI